MSPVGGFSLLIYLCWLRRWVALTEALSGCANLKKLDIRDNMFGVEAGIKLRESLVKHEYLTEIYLSYLNLEDVGATAIADALKETAPSLEVLEMAGNDITAEAAPSLASCIAEKTALVKLNLSENDLKDDGVLLISKALGVDQLKEVDMSQNSLRKGLMNLRISLKKNPINFGLLDENDPDGEDFDDKDSGDEEDEGGKDELEVKLKNLDVNQEE